MRKLLSLLAVFGLLLSNVALAQNVPVRGKVLDDQGNIIPYASVKIKGARGGTVADADGIFNVKAKPGDVLVFTSAGYKAGEVTYSGQPMVTIQLSKVSQELSDVVVTALGVKRNKSALPYATQQVSGDELNRTPTTNFVDNLSGKVAGLNITAANTMGGSTNVILRGFKSLTQSNQALFVVDGIPYDNTNQSTGGFDLGNTASDLNPDDIESVSVLKGAAASALYGSRGNNGVIMITTKRGRASKGLGVTASFGVTVGTFDHSTLPTYQTTYGEGYGSAFASAGAPSPYFIYESVPGVNSGNPVQIVQTPIDAATGPIYDPSLMVYGWDAFSPGNPNFHKATAWQPAQHHNPTDFFVTPVTTTESILASGAGDKGTYKIGFTHSDDKDFMPSANMSKNLLNLNMTQNLSDMVNVGGSFNYSQEDAKNRYLYPYTGTTNIMTDFRQWWPTNVNIQELKSDYFRTLSNASWNWQDDGTYQSNTAGHIGIPAYHDNPYWVQNQMAETDTRSRYFGNAYLNFKPVPFVNILGRVTTDQYTMLVERRANVGSLETSFYDRRNLGYNETNYDLIATVDKNIAPGLNLRGLLGGTVRWDHTTTIDASTNGGLVVPGLYALSNSAKSIAAPSESDFRKQVSSEYGDLAFTYKETYTIEGTLRRDQSSALPTNNNTYYYPSVSGNIIFSKLVPNSTWYGKLYGNYAQVGNDVNSYAINNTFNAGTPFNGGTVYSQSTTNNNINLKPETNKTWEIGVETNFFHNRLGVTADYYHSVQSDQIQPNKVSTSTGFTYFYVNGGSLQNQGVELTINATPVRTKDFSWNISVNWAKNQGKVLSLYGGQPSYEISGYQNALQLVAEVGSYYNMRGTDYVYKNGQREIDNNGRYVISSNQLTDLGGIAPDWMGGVTNTFTYKDFTLSFLVDVKQGGHLYSLDMDYGSSSGLYPQNAGLNDQGKQVRAPLAQGGGIILKGVNENTGKANTVRIDESDINTGNYTFSSAYGQADRDFVYDASYIKLREANLTYTLPHKLFSGKAVIKGIDFSLAGRNLWIIHKNEPYADPEQGQASGNASIGFQNGAYPTIRQFSAIVKLKL
ncbi:SusC/RagA family TonB-linked outer membrane protein [Dinghuibacter silviterrae]|uniref:TonB-linked SusC/RagA family outer membrane protein n=1 Tax=Dinghuibacter silviterrae TaxID=1539049 RepID=A0A4R8DEP3_9BACT|nr:SusC/RagA family TonB-linked outer membrane protein [Dinghuibacter silviterrae]TDW95718.1 TonB-linked SusC/RagA family outer membrane protein [Dinghuibacter silviterrae]